MPQEAGCLNAVGLGHPESVCKALAPTLLRPGEMHCNSLIREWNEIFLITETSVHFVSSEHLRLHFTNTLRGFGQGVLLKDQ